MVVKTFRGLLADGGQERICLETLRGKVGYRIVKFQVIPTVPGTIAQETICKIQTEQASIDGVINFSDNTLLAASYYQDSTSAGDNQATTVIFDQEIFNQDIFVTNKDVSGNTESINYYIELEVIPLTDHAAEFTTLKDIRGRTDLVAKPTP